MPGVLPAVWRETTAGGKRSADGLFFGYAGVGCHGDSEVKWEKRPYSYTCPTAPRLTIAEGGAGTFSPGVVTFHSALPIQADLPGARYTLSSLEQGKHRPGPANTTPSFLYHITDLF
jgi:hypothetical protein